MGTAHLLQQLRADNTSGATTLVERAVDLLTLFAAQAPLAPDFHTALATLVREMLAAQPSMAVMLNLAQHALQACPLDVAVKTARSQLQQTLTTFRQQLHRSTEAICQRLLTVLPPHATVLTYSNSTTVTAALQYAFDHGQVRRVFLSESRPAYDGRLQAHTLVQYGIPVEYGIDMALFERLPAAQVVLVGADAVFPHGLVNKLGTHALVQLAQLHHLPVYSLCAANKFLPAAAAPLLHIAEHPSYEVWPEAPTTLQVHNHYFDTTPLTLFTGIVSDLALYTPATLASELQRLILAPALQSLASR
jgi:translation initiation factor 2B subunit (eIF-2B alpha/beta/delta family)